MGSKLKVNSKTLPKGKLVTIKGLGAFENGKTHDITDEQEARFRTINSVVVSETNKKGETETKTVLGPSLSDAVATMDSVSLEGSGSSKSSTDNDNDKGKGDNK